MNKIALLAAAGFVLFCIVPIATTQAMPRQIQRNENAVSDTVIELSNPLLKGNVLTYDNQEFRTTMMASGDTSKNSPNPYVKRQGTNNPDEKNQGKGYPHVMRRGNGRSTMGDKVAAEKNSDVEDNGDGEDEKNEDLEDDSAITYNKDLKNSSGYNEDL